MLQRFTLRSRRSVSVHGVIHSLSKIESKTECVCTPFQRVEKVRFRDADAAAQQRACNSRCLGFHTLFFDSASGIKVCTQVYTISLSGTSVTADMGRSSSLRAGSTRFLIRPSMRAICSCEASHNDKCCRFHLTHCSTFLTERSAVA